MPSVVGQEGADDDGDGIPDPPGLPFQFRASLIQNLVAQGRYLSISGGNTIDLAPVVRSAAVNIGGTPFEAFDLFGDRAPL